MITERQRNKKMKFNEREVIIIKNVLSQVVNDLEKYKNEMYSPKEPSQANKNYHEYKKVIDKILAQVV